METAKGVNMDEMGDIVQEFLVESHENLDQLDQDLVALEADPGSRDLLSSIFRTIHTIKGTSGFLAFNRLEKVTHVGESLLARLRDGAQSMTPQTTDALLRALEREQGALYFRRIALAEREIEAGNVGRAEELLEECPAELRGWEWHYLKRRCREETDWQPLQNAEFRFRAHGCWPPEVRTLV